MKLRKLAKDPSSNQGACPAVYVAEDDPAVMVVQGKLLDAETTAELDEVLTDETAVRIPPRRWCAQSRSTSPSSDRRPDGPARHPRPR
jgi:hypothetical protein